MQFTSDKPGRVLIKLLALLATFTLAAAACGGSDEGDGDASETDVTNTEESASEDTDDTDGDEDETAMVECPHENGTVFLFGPYEANQPAGVNWRAGVDHAIADVNAEGGILGCTVEIEWQDTQADPDVSKQVVAEGAEKNPYAIIGPMFSGSTIVNMVEAQRAQIPQIVGSESPAITNREENGDNDFIFRTSFGGDNSAPKLVAYMVAQGVEKVDIIFKNDEFGAGGAGAHKDAMVAAGIEIGEEITVQPEQIDLSAEVSQLSNTDSDAVFVFFSEIETGAFFSEVAAQGFDKQLYGADPLTSGASIELATEGSADGAQSHSGVNADAPQFTEWLAAHEAFHEGITGIDHNNIKGYIGIYVLKEITERMGSFDRVAFPENLHCATITVEDEPGVLLDVSYDANGDVDRESFIVEVADGVGTVTNSVPALGNLSERGC